MSTNNATEKYYRLTNEAETHRGLQYHDGLNIDPVDFSPTGSCSAGGMYFFSREELAHFYRHVSVENIFWIREVTLPTGARVYLEDGKRKADQFILGPRQKFYMDVLLTPEQRLFAVKQCGRFIQFIENPSPEERLAAVKQAGWAIQFIKDPAAEERLTAVKQNGLAIQLIKDPTAEERLTAVKQNGMAIQFIENPSPEERLTAVNRDGWAIQFIKDPTAEERLTAVKQNGMAIQFIKDPNAEERLAAVTQNGWAIWYEILASDKWKAEHVVKTP